ncbi:hypothetical protein ACFHW1_28525, partial [Micromonospora sp. LOL_014]|uniref:hypothetical protein n=1 Tax=Micromonospora sp. LOL_014 TaxID=3345415 RepID=UPI003A88118D
TRPAHDTRFGSSNVARTTGAFVSDNQSVVTVLDGALVDPLQQVLKHYGMRRVRVGVAGTLPDYFHGSGDDHDVLRGDRFDHVIEHTDPRPNWHFRLTATRVKDLVPMEFDLRVQPIRRCRSGSNPEDFPKGVRRFGANLCLCNVA